MMMLFSEVLTYFLLLFLDEFRFLLPEKLYPLLILFSDLVLDVLDLDLPVPRLPDLLLPILAQLKAPILALYISSSL